MLHHASHSALQTDQAILFNFFKPRRETDITILWLDGKEGRDADQIWLAPFGDFMSEVTSGPFLCFCKIVDRTNLKVQLLKLYAAKAGCRPYSELTLLFFDILKRLFLTPLLLQPSLIS